MRKELAEDVRRPVRKVKEDKKEQSKPSQKTRFIAQTTTNWVGFNEIMMVPLPCGTDLIDTGCPSAVFHAGLQATTGQVSCPHRKWKHVANYQFGIWNTNAMNSNVVVSGKNSGA